MRQTISFTNSTSSSTRTRDLQARLQPMWTRTTSWAKIKITAPRPKLKSPSPPIPPLVPFLQPTVAEKTTILNARGQHLCINDMYRTAYSFRIRTDTGEVLSWASRTAVKGPKKNQDIINFYERNLGDVI